MNICVTGTSGFVGTRLKVISTHNLTCISLRNDDWKKIDFTKFDCILHLAGKAHDMNVQNTQEYYEVNVDLTNALVKKAIENQCPHFVYISSIKVYGDTVFETITENSAYNPNDDYGKSKQQAEELLLSKKEGIKIAIIRPPLIYGPGVKGNMLRMIKLASKNVPLPFGKINNKRSTVYLDNLIELIDTIISQQAEGILLPTDGSPVSTTQMISQIRIAQGKKPGLLSIPSFVRQLLKKMKPDLYTRLFGSYVLDDSQTQKQLNHTPKHTFAAGIKQMVEDYESKL